MEIEIKALLAKYQAQESRDLELLKMMGIGSNERVHRGARTQLLNEVIWDLRYLLKVLPAEPAQAKFLPMDYCPDCKKCRENCQCS